MDVWQTEELEWMCVQMEELEWMCVQTEELEWMCVQTEAGKLGRWEQGISMDDTCMQKYMHTDGIASY